MKTIIKTFAMLIITLLAFACSEDPLPYPAILSQEHNDQEFYSAFITNCYYEENASAAEKSGSWLKSSHKGTGSETHLGNFTVDVCFRFCSEGEDCGKVNSGEGCFIAETGDKLYFTFDGIIHGSIADDKVGEKGSLQGKYKLTGGTGMFNNAFGEGVIRSKVLNYVNEIQHEWAGYIQLN